MSRPQPQFPPPIYEADEAPADPMGSPRPQRQRTAAQEAARQRRLTRRSERRKAMKRFLDNELQRMFHSPNNIFNPRLPPVPMDRPESPVRQQPPNPNSNRSRRRASRQQRAERAARIASGWIYGGAKSRRVRRH